MLRNLSDKHRRKNQGLQLIVSRFCDHQAMLRNLMMFENEVKAAVQ